MSGIQLIGWVAAAVLSCGLTVLAKKYAIRKGILDVPCPRSSHTVPTPRGGGLAIMAVSLLTIALGAAGGLIAWNIALGLIGGGFMVGWVGWMDDQRELPARVRLFVHLIASLWFLGWIGGMESVTIGPHEIQLGGFGIFIAAFICVWFVNLYNFMDGIDGLAAGQAVAVGLIGGTMLFALGHPGLALIAFCVAAASAGFLVWNWAPAQIFMGDAGSGFLGFLFVGLAFASESVNAVPFTSWLILLGVFFFDATATLVRRMLRGERWREGHRLHAFQRAVQKLGSHAATSGFIILLTVPLGVAAWWLTVRPEFYFGLLVGTTGLLGLIYWGVEAVAPMFAPQREPIVLANRLQIAEQRRVAQEIFEHSVAAELVISRAPSYEQREQQLGPRTLSA